MPDSEQVTRLTSDVEAWNRWRDRNPRATVDLTGANLTGAKLNGANLLRANLAGARLAGAQLERAHLTGANLAGAVLEKANLEHANARGANFDNVAANGANFEVATLRRAHFVEAHLEGARFHRAYLRETDLSGAHLNDAWLRFANLEGARCQGTKFAGADLSYAALVDTDLRGAKLIDVRVFGISAWRIKTDLDTQQDLIVGDGSTDEVPLRAHDLQTAQLLALMLDGPGVRSVFDAVTSKLVLLLGSFSPDDKPALDALRAELIRRGYVAVTFDFQRPATRGYGETVLSLVGMARFVIADFTNAKEVRAEVSQARRNYMRVPVVLTVRGEQLLPDTLVDLFSPEELDRAVRYRDTTHLIQLLDDAIIKPAEARASQIAAQLTRSRAVGT